MFLKESIDFGDILKKCQLGFRQQRWLLVPTVVARNYKKWTNNLENEREIRSFLADMCKAFSLKVKSTFSKRVKVFYVANRKT